MYRRYRSRRFGNRGVFRRRGLKRSRRFFRRGRVFRSRVTIGRKRRGFVRRRTFKRRFTRRFGRRRFRKGGVTARKVINALAPWQSFMAHYGQQNDVPPTSAATGTLATTSGDSRKVCKYYTVELYDPTSGGGAITSDTVTTVGLNDYRHLGVICNSVWKGQVQLGTNAPVGNSTQYDTNIRSKILIKGYQLSQVRNVCNEPVIVKTWVVRPRRDVPLQAIGLTGWQNLYQYLSNGFAANGLDPTHIVPTTNATMFDADYTPYQSYIFCRFFKIRRLKPRTVSPGRMVQYKLKSKTQEFKPIDLWYTSGDTTQTSWDGTTAQRVWDMHRKMKFILFRIESSPETFGAAQARYTKLIQETQPRVLTETTFRYEAKFLHEPRATMRTIERTGMIDPTLAGQAGNIVIEDGDAGGAMQVQN